MAEQSETMNEEDRRDLRERMQKVLEHVESQLDETTHLLLVTVCGEPGSATLSQHKVGLTPESTALLCTHVLATEFGLMEVGEELDL